MFFYCYPCVTLQKHKKSIITKWKNSYFATMGQFTHYPHTVGKTNVSFFRILEKSSACHLPPAEASLSGEPWRNDWHFLLCPMCLEKREEPPMLYWPALCSSSNSTSLALLGLIGQFVASVGADLLGLLSRFTGLSSSCHPHQDTGGRDSSAF